MKIINTRFKIGCILFGLVLSLISTLYSLPAVSAVTAADWQAGYIIDDALFYDNSAMSTAEIQTFLNTKVATCDTNGTSPASEYGRSDITHAQYAALQGWPGPPYVCLRNYRQMPQSDQIISSFTTSLAPGDGSLSAAEIIKNAADTYGVSPKALLAILQKESPGPLITDTWPLLSQYKNAMGYGCPDTAPCDPVYAGFYNQMTNAARQFKLYRDNPNSYRYKPFQDNAILFNPNQNCGASTVNIQNYATAGLYIYTPYQPNSAALSNLYGLGDSCSAYGNRNFWRIYNDWFGPSTSIQNIITMNIISAPDSTPARGQEVSYTYSLTNKMSYDITLDAVGVVGRFGNVYSGKNEDFGWVGPVILKAGTTQDFTFTTIIKDVGAIYAWPAIFYQNRYTHYNNWGAYMISHQPNLVLSAPLTTSSQNPVAGQNVSFSATVKNNEDSAIHIDAIGIPVRFYGVYNYDVYWTAQSNVISQGATQNLSGNITFDKPGPYTAWISWRLGENYTTISPVLNIDVKSPTPDFSMSYTSTPNTAPALGEDVSIGFKLKNNLGVPMKLDAVGVVGRYSNPFSGQNRDFGWVGPETFTANEEKSYSFTSRVTRLDKFYAWVALNYKGSYVHYNNWGFMLNPHKPDLSAVSLLSVNPANLVVGQNATFSVSIKNNEPHPINYTAIGIPVRYYGVYNYDSIWSGPGLLAASGQQGDSLPLSGTILIDKAGPYTAWSSINISGNYLTVGNLYNTTAW